jgi:ABC-type dipeptide/oligopeptide/nickel transport system permease component
MTQPTKHQRWWLPISFIGIISLIFVLGSQFDLPQRLTLPLIVVTLLAFGTMAVWMRANTNATGEEWWQDDSSSGWRGY